MSSDITFTENEKTNNFPQSSYQYSIIELNNILVGIVLDNNEDNFMSVTNNIDNIANDLNVSHIIYKDSEGVFDYWQKQLGFRSLSVQGHETHDLTKALQMAQIAYIKK